MDDFRATFVISKLVDELNAQFEENGGEAFVLYDEEIEEINQAIRRLGIDCQLKKEEY
jgi:hypothetical protein